MTRLISPDVVSSEMARARKAAAERREKPKFPPAPSATAFEKTIRQLCQDALAIQPMYRRLHELGLDRRRLDSQPSSGPTLREDGSETGYVPELAVESGYADSRREYARWVASEIAKVAKTLDKIHQGLERSVGPTAGFRQPTSTGDDAAVTSEELRSSLDNQAERLKRGLE